MRIQDGQPSDCMNMCFKGVSQISFSHVCYRKRNDKNCLSSVQKTSPSLSELSSLTVASYQVYVYCAYSCDISKTCNNRVIFHKYVFPNSYISPLESSPPDSVKYKHK
jgi:hypothetical protein